MDEVREEIRAGAAPLKAVDNVAKKGLGKLATADVGKLFLAIAGASSVCCAAVAGAKGIFRAVVRRVPLVGRPAAVAADVLLPSGLYGSLLAGYLAVTAVRASLQKLSAERGDEGSESGARGSVVGSSAGNGSESEGLRESGSAGVLGAGMSANRRNFAGRSKSGNSLSSFEGGGGGEDKEATAAGVGNKGKNGGFNSHLWAKLHPHRQQQQHKGKRGHAQQQQQQQQQQEEQGEVYYGHSGGDSSAGTTEEEQQGLDEDGSELRRKGRGSSWVGARPLPLPVAPRTGSAEVTGVEEDVGAAAEAGGGGGGGGAIGGVAKEGLDAAAGGAGGGGRGRKGFLRGKRQHREGGKDKEGDIAEQQEEEDGGEEGCEAPVESKRALFGWWKGKVERANSSSSSKSLDFGPSPLGRTQSAGAAVFRTSSLGSSASAAPQGYKVFGPSFGPMSYDFTRRNSLSEGFMFTALPVEPKSDAELQQLKQEQLTRQNSVSEGCKQVVAKELKVTAKKVEHMASMAPMITRLPSGRGGCRITAAAAAAAGRGKGESPRVSSSDSQQGSPTHSLSLGSPRELGRSPRTSSESSQGGPVPEEQQLEIRD
jgi:hypothetical protein